MAQLSIMAGETEPNVFAWKKPGAGAGAGAGAGVGARLLEKKSGAGPAPSSVFNFLQKFQRNWVPCWNTKNKRYTLFVFNVYWATLPLISIFKVHYMIYMFPAIWRKKHLCLRVANTKGKACALVDIRLCGHINETLGYFYEIIVKAIFGHKANKNYQLLLQTAGLSIIINFLWINKRLITLAVYLALERRCCHHTISFFGRR